MTKSEMNHRMWLAETHGWTYLGLSQLRSSCRKRCETGKDPVVMKWDVTQCHGLATPSS